MGRDKGDGGAAETDRTAGVVARGRRLRASATKFDLPATCWTSEVNSQMLEKWRHWRADWGSEDLNKAETRGLWSVKRVKGRPSTK